MDKGIVHIPMKDEPVLLDKIIQDLQNTLKTKLAWLDYAFGRAYRLVEHRPDDKKFVYPAAYIGNAEYFSLVPNDNLGNFSWFDIYDAQDVISGTIGRPQLVVKGAIVFWFDLSSIFSDTSAIYTEEVKDEILSLLTSGGIITGEGHLTINKIYERFDSLYKGYSIEKVYNNYMYSGEDIQDIDKQYFMYPYAGLRFEFELVTRELCQRWVR